MSRVLVADDNPLSLAFFRDAIALVGHAGDFKHNIGTNPCRKRIQ